MSNESNIPKPSEVEVICPNEECGDPVPFANGARTKRRMIYASTNPGLFFPDYVFACPVCGRRRMLDTSNGKISDY